MNPSVSTPTAFSVSFIQCPIVARRALLTSFLDAINTGSGVDTQEVVIVMYFRRSVIGWISAL